MIGTISLAIGYRADMFYQHFRTYIKVDMSFSGLCINTIVLEASLAAF